MVKVSAWTNLKSLMRNIVVELLKAFKEESICLLSMSSGYGCPKVEKNFSLELCTGGMEVPLCDTW